MARILIADDDQALRDLVRKALAGEGHDIEVAEDGNAALAKLAGGLDLLISDIQMPGLDGIALSERAIAAMPALRVILMTGLADANVASEKLGTNLERVMTKPFSLDDVRTAVRKALA